MTWKLVWRSRPLIRHFILLGRRKDKDRYKKMFYQGQTDSNKQRSRKSVHDDVEEALIKWFTSIRSQNVPINGPIMIAKAENFAKQLGKPNWTCSAGWLDRFKNAMVLRIVP